MACRARSATSSRTSLSTWAAMALPSMSRAGAREEFIECVTMVWVGERVGARRLCPNGGLEDAAKPVGASLLAIAADQAMQGSLAPSPASRLLQGSGSAWTAGSASQVIGVLQVAQATRR